MAEDVISSAEPVDNSRRRLLLTATSAVGAIGVGLTAIPFVESWLPSERARALGAPTEVDLSKIEPGQMIIAVWRRNPIFVVHRTPAMMSTLGSHSGLLKDPGSESSNQPEYCKNEIRARKPEYFVCIGTCTHLGCLPKPHFDAGDPQLGASWPGGWLCPCHGSRFDLAGRVFDGSPASINLNIPSYAYQSDIKLVIGVDDAASATGAGATGA
jgi:ubiquinol-cytochrome c reductase iron-sulfur subunit